MFLLAWTKDTREQNIGMANRENVHRLLASLATYPFTELLQ